MPWLWSHAIRGLPTALAVFYSHGKSFLMYWEWGPPHRAAAAWINTKAGGGPLYCPFGSEKRLILMFFYMFRLHISVCDALWYVTSRKCSNLINMTPPQPTSAVIAVCNQTRFCNICEISESKWLKILGHLGRFPTMHWAKVAAEEVRGGFPTSTSTFVLVLFLGRVLMNFDDQKKSPAVLCVHWSPSDPHSLL